jgi:hypothetical protein
VQKDLSMLICGFGCHLNDSLSGYLNRAVALCKALKPHYVVFSGGATQQRTAPGLTEAQVMYDFVVPRCGELTGTDWICDHNAFTSVENVINTKRALLEHTVPGRLLTYTDASRTLKVRLGTYWLMREWQITQETYDLHSNPVNQVVSLALEAPMIIIPALHKPWSLYRRGWRAKRI